MFKVLGQMGLVMVCVVGCVFVGGGIVTNNVLLTVTSMTTVLGSGGLFLEITK